MLEYSELEELEMLKEVGYNDLLKAKTKDGVSYLSIVFRLHLKLFGEACTGCAGKIPSYVKRVLNYKPVIVENTTKKFKLKEGVMIRVLGTNDYLSNHNITDELALAELKKNPNRISLFSKFPKDWNSPKVVKKATAKKSGSKK